MTHEPAISVVMAIFNEQSTLAVTIDSVLQQTHENFEFIIVDDGSVDDSADILASYAKNDTRIQILSQSNKGLTQALADGCRVARGKYIARQDAGDISLASRLQVQLAQLEAHTDCVMCSVGTAFIAPDGEVYAEHSQTSQQADQGLRRWSLEHIEGPSHHGAVMFRRDTYTQVGGYRAAFKVAQDLDLWTRMIEFGKHCASKDILYHAYANANSISALRRDLQLQAANFIFQCCEARQESGDDSAVIEAMSKQILLAPKVKSNQAVQSSNFYYFLGSNLMASNRSAAKKYLSLSLNENRWNWRARWKRWLA